MIWTLFVLDLDGTYNNAEPDSLGVAPFVYLIPLENQKDVEFYAKQASATFHQPDYEYDSCIGDLFEEFLEQNGITFKPVGSIEVPFSQRQTDYIADYIPRMVV